MAVGAAKSCIVLLFAATLVVASRDPENEKIDEGKLSFAKL